MKYKAILILSMFLFPFPGMFSQDTDSLAAHYRQKVLKYLDKEKALSDYYLIDTSGVKIYPSAQAKKKDSAEYVFKWYDLDVFKNTRHESDFYPSPWHRVPALSDHPYPVKTADSEGNITSAPLNGIYIALDPGHMAADMETAKLEKKFIDMQVTSKSGKNQRYELIEAQFTLATALLLQKKLIEAGATVMLTREIPGITAFGITYDEWLATRFKQMLDSAYSFNHIDQKEKIFLETKATRTEIFRRFFSNLETKERARKINHFNPHLTVVIHYNVDEANTGWKKPTTKNFCMTFVGGGFMKDELEKPDARESFLRLLLTDDIEKSIEACDTLISSFENILKVPVAGAADATYLTKYSIATEEKGVFCRNLTLTRLINGPMIYGETLYQDNENELPRLGFNTIPVNGLTTSGRVKQVSDAYFEGIMNYFRVSK